MFNIKIIIDSIIDYQELCILLASLNMKWCSDKTKANPKIFPNYQNFIELSHEQQPMYIWVCGESISFAYNNEDESFILTKEQFFKFYCEHINQNKSFYSDLFSDLGFKIDNNTTGHLLSDKKVLAIPKNKLVCIADVDPELISQRYIHFEKYSKFFTSENRLTSLPFLVELNRRLDNMVYHNDKF